MNKHVKNVLRAPGRAVRKSSKKVKKALKRAAVESRLVKKPVVATE